MRYQRVFASAQILLIPAAVVCVSVVLQRSVLSRWVLSCTGCQVDWQSFALVEECMASVHKIWLATESLCKPTGGLTTTICILAFN